MTGRLSVHGRPVAEPRGQQRKTPGDAGILSAMKKRLLAFGVVGLALISCRSAPLGVEAGPAGGFRSTLTVRDETLVVEGKDGRLLVAGEDRGPVQSGDWVTVDWDGEVRVNGVARY